MDWYSWLSKSGLNPSLVYDYSLLFADNELEEEDFASFDHEFLKSIGISVAKHRLEILKLAKKRKSPPPRPVRPVVRLLAAVARTKKCLSKCIHIPVDNSAIVVVPKPPAYATGGLQWRGAMLKCMKGLARLPITDSGVEVARRKSSSVSRATSPMVYRGQDQDDRRWDSMFRNMKPT